MIRTSGVLKDRVTASRLRETSGPTVLAVGALANGEFLKRLGATVVSGSPAAGGGDTPTTHVGDATLTAPAGTSRHVGDTSGGNLVLTLPAAAAADPTADLQFLKAAAANTLKVRPNGAETINGQAGDLTLSDLGDSARLWPTTGGWLIVNPSYIYA